VNGNVSSALIRSSRGICVCCVCCDDCDIVDFERNALLREDESR
jgi:hypothetical protein